MIKSSSGAFRYFEVREGRPHFAKVSVCLGNRTGEATVEVARSAYDWMGPERIPDWDAPEPKAQRNAAVLGGLKALTQVLSVDERDTTLATITEICFSVPDTELRDIEYAAFGAVHSAVKETVRRNESSHGPMKANDLASPVVQYAGPAQWPRLTPDQVLVEATKFVSRLDLKGWSYRPAHVWPDPQRFGNWIVVVDTFAPDGFLVDGPVILYIDDVSSAVKFGPDGL